MYIIGILDEVEKLELIKKFVSPVRRLALFPMDIFLWTLTVGRSCIANFFFAELGRTSGASPVILKLFLI
jgi:hypothetical protein